MIERQDEHDGELGEDDAEGQGAMKVRNYNSVYEAMRRTYEKQWCKSHRARGKQPARIGRHERPQVRLAFSKLNNTQRMELCQRALTEERQRGNDVEDLRRHHANLQRRVGGFLRREEEAQKRKECVVAGNYVLLTYMGGPLTLPCSEPAALHGGGIAALVAALQQTASVKTLVQECTKFVGTLTAQKKVQRFAWALEVCPRTYEAEGKVRIHMHLALIRHPALRNAISSFAFGACIPCANRCVPTQRDKKASGPASVMFYCQVDKIGQLHSAGSHSPFHDYHINPEWITNLLQANKITESTARRLYVQGCKNVVHHLQNLDRIVAERQQLALQSRIALVQTSCAAGMQAFKDVPLVRERFLPHFQSIKPRYPFLVLEGPSKTGKTSFAKHITGDPTEVLEVNCANCPEPDLRDFDCNVHRAILYDEANPQLVLSQRRLFQSPTCLLDMGCSQTNCHKYQVFVSGTMMIVCSNTWSEQVDQLEHEGDAEWLQSNSIVVHVRERLFYEPPAGPA